MQVRSVGKDVTQLKMGYLASTNDNRKRHAQNCPYPSN